MASRSGSRAGFTLIEALVVITAMGLLMLMVGPRVQQIRQQTNMRSGVNAVSAMYSRARTVAVSRGQEARLMLATDSAWVTVQTAGGVQQVGTAEKLTEQFGIVLGGTDSIRIGSTGLPIGIATRAPITVTKGAKVESLFVSRYGRME